MSEQKRVGIIGYGEVGRSLAQGFVEAGIPVAAFDLCFSDPLFVVDANVDAAGSIAELVGACDVIWVCTQAAAIEVVATEVAGCIAGRHLVVDLASAPAESKIRAARALGPRHDAYIDIALSAPPLQDGISARMYASGPRAVELIAWGDGHGMDLRYLGERVGQATQLKILRATLTKGLEAILLESMATALAYDVDPNTVLETVASAFDDRPFKVFCEYLVATGVVHDNRRAIEVGEAALMAEQAGMVADMARAAERVLTRSSQLHRPDDPQEWVSALRTYAQHAGERSVATDPELAVGSLSAHQ